MEKEKDVKAGDDQIHLPPGFRFHPSDEELIVHYLRNKTTNKPLPAAAIFAEVELYKFNPWDLPMKASSGEEEWYFFSPRDRKYPNGMRPNRTASSGYWKATGTDKPILSSSSARDHHHSKIIGVKKALVFYVGRPPKGNKTDWIMHEYRLPADQVTCMSHKKEKTMRLDDWVLCRVRQKTGMAGQFLENRNVLYKEPDQAYKKLEKQYPMGVGATTAPMAHMPRDYPMPPILLGFQNPCMEAAAVSTTMSLQGKKTSTEIFQYCMDTTAAAAVSNISFEGNKTTSSVCEDNFNIDYDWQNSVDPPFSNTNGSLDMMRKRKRTDGNSEDLSFRNMMMINKKPAHKEFQRQHILEYYSATDDTTGAAVSCSTSQVDKNTSFSTLDELGSMNMSMLMYQDVYSWPLM